MSDGRVGPLDESALFRSRPHATLAEIAQRLQRVRIVPGFHGDPDLLRVIVVTRNRASALAGVDGMGFGVQRADAAKAFRDGNVNVAVHGESAAAGPGITFSIGGNEPGASWTFGEHDVRLAEELETEFIGADWILGFREPEHAVTPESYPWMFAR